MKTKTSEKKKLQAIKKLTKAICKYDYKTPDEFLEKTLATVSGVGMPEVQARLMANAKKMREKTSDLCRCNYLPVIHSFARWNRQRAIDGVDSHLLRQTVRECYYNLTGREI